MTKPMRIQMRRTKGWRKPEGAIYVGRPSKFGNPYRVAEHGEVAVEMFADDLEQLLANPDAGQHLEEMRRVARHLESLRGHDLACWCPAGQPCHADVLLELANRPA